MARLTDSERDRLLTDCELEMDSEKSRTITIEYSVVQAMGLLGTLQLALRHPKNTGATSRYMRELARHIEAFLSECGPATARLCKLGWDQAEDVD